jgi:hypothetical protein
MRIGNFKKRGGGFEFLGYRFEVGKRSARNEEP